MSVLVSLGILVSYVFSVALRSRERLAARTVIPIKDLGDAEQFDRRRREESEELAPQRYDKRDVRIACDIPRFLGRSFS